MGLRAYRRVTRIRIDENKHITSRDFSFFTFLIKLIKPEKTQTSRLSILLNLSYNRLLSLNNFKSAYQYHQYLFINYVFLKKNFQ